MNNPTLQQRLIEQHKALAEYVQSLSDEEFTRTKPEKWTAGQHLQHIVMSVDLTTMAMSNRSFLRACDPAAHTRDYDGVVKFYLDTLQGKKVVAPPQFSPEPVAAAGKNMLVKTALGTIEMLAATFGKFSEEELDGTSIMHPALGAISLREMGYFTIYHAQHHHELIEAHLA